MASGFCAFLEFQSGSYDLPKLEKRLELSIPLCVLRISQGTRSQRHGWLEIGAHHCSGPKTWCYSLFSRPNKCPLRRGYVWNPNDLLVFVSARRTWKEQEGKSPSSSSPSPPPPPMLFSSFLLSRIRDVSIAKGHPRSEPHPLGFSILFMFERENAVEGSSGSGPSLLPHR